jgi:uncharacterized protein YggE
MRLLPLLTVLAAVAVFTPTAHAEQEAIPKLISTTGFCSRDVVPDRGRIQLTAVVENKDLKTAIALATKQYEQVRAEILALKLPNAEFATNNYSIEEQWDYVQPNNKRERRGYQARMGLSVVTSDLSRLGDVIAVASKNAVADVGQLQLFLSPPKKTEAEKSCLEEAASDARDRALKLAKGAGVKLGNLQNLNSSGGFIEPAPPRPIMQRGAMVAASPDFAPSIEPGQQTIQITVNASFFID